MPAMLILGSARAVALILNALTGLLQFYERDYDQLNVDGILGLRLMQGQLEDFSSAFAHNGLPEDVIIAMRNISHGSAKIAERAIAAMKERQDEYYAQVGHLIDQPYKIGLFPHRKVDARRRWSAKAFADEDAKGQQWFYERSDACLQGLFDKECRLSEDCLQTMLVPTGTKTYVLTHQILYVSYAQLSGCLPRIERFLASINWGRTAEDLVLEMCTNVYEEYSRYEHDRAKLERLSRVPMDLLMEQVWVCGQFGFVDFASSEVLNAALAWQHPQLGCYTAYKPRDAAYAGLNALFGFGLEPKVRNVREELPAKDFCLSHLSTVTTGALLSFLRLLLDPSPWSEHRLDNPLTGEVPAEGRYAQFRYTDWVTAEVGGLSSARELPHQTAAQMSLADLSVVAYLLVMCCAGLALFYGLLLARIVSRTALKHCTASIIRLFTMEQNGCYFASVPLTHVPSV